MDIWHPIAGCGRITDDESEGGCIWVYGMPIHLWGFATFKKLGKLCGGFLESHTFDPVSIEWVKLKVRQSWKALKEIWISDGILAFRITI